LNGIFNAIWSGFRPIVLLAVGALLLPLDQEGAAEFYTFALVWTVGYSLCSLTLDRHVVVIAQRGSRTVAEALRALIPWWFVFGAIACIVLTIPSSWLSDTPLEVAVVALIIGTAAGMAEAALWAFLAEQSQYGMLAAVRLITSIAFVTFCVGWLSIGFPNSHAYAFAIESCLLIAIACFILLRPVARAPRIDLCPKTIFGLWFNRTITYLSMQLDAWWTVVALSPILLAAYRIGTPLRSFILLLTAALVQTLVFKISSTEWSSIRPLVEGSVRKVISSGVAVSSAIACVLAMFVIMRLDFVSTFGTSIVVAWLVLSFHSGVGWFGMLGSTLLSNRGAVRLPIIATTLSVVIRSSMYAVLLLMVALNLQTLIVSTEILVFATQLLYWRQVRREGLWNLTFTDYGLLAIRALIATGAIVAAVYASNGSIGQASWVILGCHLALIASVIVPFAWKPKGQ
jgi:hypothetical protein